MCNEDHFNQFVVMLFKPFVFAVIVHVNLQNSVTTTTTTTIMAFYLEELTVPISRVELKVERNNQFF